MNFNNSGLVNDGFCRPTDEAADDSVQPVIDHLREQVEANTDTILADYESKMDLLVEEAKKHAA